MIGELLGHTQVQTTARYAHLAADPVKAAAEQVSAVVAQAVLGEERNNAAAGG
jgi:hypothetical protein